MVTVRVVIIFDASVVTAITAPEPDPSVLRLILAALRLADNLLPAARATFAVSNAAFKASAVTVNLEGSAAHLP